MGTKNGEITLWEAGIREKLHSKPFKIWNMNDRTLIFQVIASSFKIRCNISTQLLITSEQQLLLLTLRTEFGQDCVAAVNDPQFSVNRVVWSPDGTFCGIFPWNIT